jgi:conserved hypothetical protein
MRSAAARAASFAARLALTAGCALYALWGIDVRAMFEAFGRYRPGPVALTFAFSLVLYLIAALRLSYLGRGRISLRRAFLANLLCLGLNNVFPARLGEVAKLTYLRRTEGLPFKAGIGIIFWERFFDLNMLLLLTLASTADLGRSTTLLCLVSVCGAVWAALTALTFFPRLVARLNALVLPKRMHAHVEEFAGHLREGLSLRLLANLGVRTMILWGCTIVFYGLVFCWVGGIDLRPSQLALAFVIMALGYNLPSTPGGLGLFEASVVLSLGWFGVPRETALPLSLLLRALQYLPTIPSALAILVTTGLTTVQLRTEQESLYRSQR